MIESRLPRWRDRDCVACKPYLRIVTPAETGGAGFGLSLARTVVHAHGGEITLSNRPGGGLRAIIQLPR